MSNKFKISNIIFTLVYELALIFIALAALPYFFYQLIVKKKYRKSLLKRFGSNFPLIKKGDRSLVWIHAVSLGETKAVATLAKKIKKDLQNPIIIFSTTTETGYVEACRTINADHHVYLPFDFGWIIKPILKRTVPDLVILCESDFWYNFLRFAKKQGASVVLVNGKISKKSIQRFIKTPYFCNVLFSKIDLFCVQSALYRNRFELIGIPKEKILVTGNMKFDGEYSKLPTAQIDAWRKELGIKPSDPVLVVGSSHHPEETQILKVASQLWLKVPKLKIIIVPRHPERFNEVAGVLQKHKIGFRRLSIVDHPTKPASVILIDAMGLLRKCYQLADIAIVGGSYTTKVGGHNILEPSWYGVPVIFGPNMMSQPDLVELVKEYEAGLQVPIENLCNVLLDLFQNEERRKTIGSAGLRLSSEVHGATKKTWALIKAHTNLPKKSISQHI